MRRGRPLSTKWQAVAAMSAGSGESSNDPTRRITRHNFGNRLWIPAVESAGIETPARLYDLRSTFASNALAAGITTFELARIMGTSVGMIEAHYGALIDTAHDAILGRLEAVSG